MPPESEYGYGLLAAYVLCPIKLQETRKIDFLANPETVLFVTRQGGKYGRAHFVRDFVMFVRYECR